MRNLAVLLAFTLALAAPAGHAADDVVTRLAARFRVPVADIAPAPLPGLYRVILGPQVAYVTADGRYLIHGDIIDLADGNNLTETERDQARIAYMDSIGEKNMIVFTPTDTKYEITVLTDIDCGYCRQLAKDQPQLLALGVAVRYLPYPRTGVGSPSWDKAVRVWCAKDRQDAYLDAMRGLPVNGEACKDNPVAAGYEFAMRLGLEGTPGIITDKGRLISGYLPPQQLVQLLDSSGKPAAATASR